MCVCVFFIVQFFFFFISQYNSLENNTRHAIFKLEYFICIEREKEKKKR
jgi:hypothetical protein